MKELTRKLTEADIEKNGPLITPDLSDESFHKIGLMVYENKEAHQRFNRFVDGFSNVSTSHLRVHDNYVNFLIQDLINYGIEPSKAEEIRYILSNSVKSAPIPKDGTAKVKNIVNLISNNPGSFDYASEGAYRLLGVKINPEDVGLEVRKSVKPRYELTHGERDARSLVNNSIEDMEIATIKQIADLGFSSQDQYDEYVGQVKEYFEDAIENPSPMPFLNRVNQILKYLGATPIKESSLVTKKDALHTEPLLEFAEYSYHGRQVDKQIYDLPEEVRESLVDSYVNAKTPTGYKEYVYTWDNNPPHLTTRDDHFKGDNIIANAISYEVTGNNGKKYLFIDEIQSTPFQSMTPEERAKYPLSSNWIDVIAKHMVREAAERDLDGIVFSTSQMMRDQHGERSGKELFEFVYDKRLPSVLKKLTGNKQAIPIATYSGPSRELITEAGRDYQAYLDYEGIEDIYTYAADFDAEVREAFTVRNPTMLSVQLTPEVKRKILTGGTPLWGAGIGASSFLANDESFTGEEYQEASLFGEVLSHALKYVEPKRAPLSTAKKAPKPVVDFDSFRSSTSVSNSFRDYAHTFGGYEAGQKAVEEEKLASLTGTSVSTIRRVNGGKIDDSLLHSQIQMINDSVRQVDHFAKVAAEDPTVSNLAKWVSQWRTHRAVVETISGNYRKADEELAKFRNHTGSVRDQEILDEIGGKGFAEYSLGLYNELKGVQARSTFLRTSLYTRTKDGVYAAWVNGLLSNLATQVVNLLSTTAFMGFRTIERTIAGTIPGGDITMAEGPMVAAGFIHGMIDTMKLGYMFTTENMFRDTPTKEYADFRERLGSLGFDDAFKKIEANEKYNVISGAAFGQEGVLGAGIDMLGWGLTWPGRSLQITDAVTKSIAYRGELYALAYRHANRVYKETNDMAKASAAFDNAIKFPSETMHRAAVNEARVVTFTKELGELGQSVEGAFNNLFLGRFFLPFIRTPANLLKQGFRRTAGVNLLTPSMWADLRAGGTRRQEAIAALGVSSSLASVAAYMASEGLLTGSVDFDKRSYYQQMSLSGKQRYSIKVGEDYYSFGRFEPLATPLAIWADAYEVMSMVQDQDDLDLVANAAVASVVEVVREKAFLQSFSGLADIVFPNDPSNVSSLLEREVGRQASSLVPNIVSKSGPVFEMFGVFDNDPSIRVTDVDESEFERSLPGVQTFYRVLNEVIARTPGLSDSLPPLRGAFGEEIPRGTDSLADLYSPFYYSEGKYSKIGKELERLGTYIALPPRDYMGVKLSPSQNDRLNVIRANEVIIGGRSFKEHLEYMMESPMYLNLPTDDLRVMEIKNEVSDFNEIAMDMLIAEDPEIARKAEQLEKELYGVE